MHVVDGFLIFENIYFDIRKLFPDRISLKMFGFANKIFDLTANYNDGDQADSC